MGPPIFIGQPGATVTGVVAFWVLFAVWVLTETWLGWRRQLPEGVPARDRGSRWLLIAAVWTGVAVGIGLALLAPAAAFTHGRDAILALGLALVLAGLLLRWYAIRVLGGSFTCTVATRAGQRVVDSGPYRWVRHPSYTGGLLTVLGVLVCCANPLSLIALILPVAGYAYRIHVEEEALTNSLGDAYRAYMRRTRRLVPFVV